MGNFLWINFWIVLFYVCFPANSFPFRTENNIKLMLTNVKCEGDSKFYTPTSTNLTTECITAALECFLAEIKTIREECEDPEVVIDYTEEFLEEHIEIRKKDAEKGVLTSAVCPCESWPLRPFTDHLKEMGSLAERVLSVANEYINL